MDRTPVGALLVCAGGGLGDVLLATPVARALRARFGPVVALTTSAQREVLEGNPDIDEVWTDEHSWWSLRARIAARRFRACAVTWSTLRYATAVAAAGIPLRAGQSRRLYSGCYTHRVDVRSEFGDRTTHWTQILLDYARALGCDAEDGMPVFRLSPESEERRAALLASHGLSGEYALLHPTRGISALRRRWPVEGLQALLAALRARYGIPVLVTGTAQDAPIAQRIAQDGRGISLAGATSLGDFAALAAGARFTVAMDSGPMHVAAAVGSPTVGIFALASDEPDRWRPLGRRVAIVRPTYPCPPAHRKETCPDFPCVRELDVRRILGAVDGLLDPRTEA